MISWSCGVFLLSSVVAPVNNNDGCPNISVQNNLACGNTKLFLHWHRSTLTRRTDYLIVVPAVYKDVWIYSSRCVHPQESSSRPLVPDQRVANLRSRERIGQCWFYFFSLWSDMRMYFHSSLVTRTFSHHNRINTEHFYKFLTEVHNELGVWNKKLVKLWPFVAHQKFRISFPTAQKQHDARQKLRFHCSFCAKLKPYFENLIKLHCRVSLLHIMQSHVTFLFSQ